MRLQESEAPEHLLVESTDVRLLTVVLLARSAILAQFHVSLKNGDRFGFSTCVLRTESKCRLLVHMSLDNLNIVDGVSVASADVADLSFGCAESPSFSSLR